MRSFLPAICLCLLMLPGIPDAARASAPQPVSVQDLCLMLRSGYSPNEVIQETSNRPLLDPITPESEKALRTAGADGRLIEALKAKGTASPNEAAVARQQQALQAGQRAAEAARQAQVQREAQPAPTAAAVADAHPAPTPDAHAVENLLNGRLSVLRDGRVQPVSKDALEGKKLFGLYYSTFLSQAGSKFSPDLVQFYHGIVAKHPEFEIVLLSSDRSPFAMENQMRRAQMDWPVLPPDQLKQVPTLARFADPSGGSRLVLVDQFGRMRAVYSISMENRAQIPLVLPELEKMIADPAMISAVGSIKAAAPAQAAR